MDEPDTGDERQNAYRSRLLGDFRGYRRNESIFQWFPDVVSWERVILSRDELEKVRYIEYGYWVELSGGSRLALDAARRIAAGLIPEEEAGGYWGVADAIRRGVPFPEMILVATSREDRLVVLGGHVRLTAYLLQPEGTPAELQLIAGFSPAMPGWGLY